MDLQTIVSLVSNILLLVLFGIVLISSLVGLLKGFWKSLVSLVIWTIALSVVFGFNMFFTELYFQMDLSFILKHIGNLVIVINENEISLLQSVGGIVTDVMEVVGLSTATEAAKALALSFLSLFVLAFHLVITCILCPIVCLIVNNTFTRFVQKKVVKKKLRIAGFFVNGLKMAVISVFLLTPTFNILENIVNSYNVGLKDDYQYDEEKSNEVWKYAYPVLQGYNDSFLHKFFNVVTGSGQFNGFYTATVRGEKNTKVNFMEIIDGVSSVAVATLSTVEEFSEASITSAVLADHTLEVLTSEVLSSAFLMGEVLPIAITLGVEAMINMEDPIISVEDGKLLETEIGHIDFSADLSSYVELFRLLNKEDLITEAITEYGSFDFKLSRENQPLFKEALSEFKKAQDSIKNDPSKTTILDVVLPPVLSSLVKNSSSEEMPINEILPTEPEGYRALDLVEVLQVTTDVLFNVNDLYVNMASSNNELNVANKNSIKKVSNEVDDLSVRTINLLIENNNFIRSLFYKDNVFEGVLDSRDESGNTYIKTLDLFVGNDNDKGLLDIDFLVSTFPKIINFALDTFVKGDNSPINIEEELLNEITDFISTYETKEQWGTEFDALLKCVGTIFDNEDLPILVLDEQGNFASESITIDISNVGTQNVVKELCDYIDHSNIIVKLFPPILKSTIDFNSIPMLAEYNITGDDLNFEFTEGSTLGSEIKDLIDAFSYVVDLDFTSNILTSDSLNADEIYHAFEYMVDCQIINPEPVNGDVSHNMMKKIVVGLMNSKELSDFGIHLDESLYDEKLINGGLLGELRNICDILNTIKTSDSLQTIINSEGTVNISDIKGQDVEDLITSIAKSDFLRPCLSTVVEKQLSPIFENLGLDPKYFNFELMENASSDIWSDEGHKLNVIVEELKVLAGNDFESVDWINLLSDETKQTNIKNLFTSLQSLHFLEEEYYDSLDLEKENPYDRFGLIIYSFLEKSLTDYINDTNKEQIKKDFSFVYYDDYFIDIYSDKNINTLSRNELWEKEIDTLLDVFSSISPLLKDNGDSKVLTITIDSSSINDITRLIVGDETNNVSGINDLTMFRTVLSSILDKTFGDGSGLSIEGFDLSEAYMHTDIFEVGYELNFQTGDRFVDFATKNIDKPSNNVLSNRDAEVALRKNEISLILDIAKDIFDLGEFSLDNLSNWVNDNFLGNLLNKVHDSKIMHTPTEALKNNKITVFEKIVDVVLENSVSKLIYESKEQRLEVIQKITASEIIDADISWDDPLDGEINKLSSAIESINGLKTATGEDTPLKKFVFGASDAPSNLNISILNEDAENKEIEVIINALSKSLLVNPDERISSIYTNNSLLGKLFDDNIGSSLSDIGMKNHSFRKSDLFNDDWNNEAKALSNLVNEFKKLDDCSDLSKIEWSSIESSTLKTLFLCLYKVPSMSANYGYTEIDENNESYGKSSFEDLVYYVVDTSFNTDSNNDGVKDLFDDEDLKNIELDVYSIDDKYSWFTTNELNGEIENNPGETNKFINLLDSASTDGYGILKDGTFVMDNFTKFSDKKQGYGVEILKELNDIHFLRTVFASVFENSFASNSGFAIGSLDVNKIYASLFSEVLNYKTNNSSLSITNREEEVNERNKEIEYIIEIVKCSEDINELLNNTNTNIDSFTNEHVDVVFEMLRALNASRLFHVGRYKVGGNFDTTFFEDTIILILEKESIADQIYNAERDVAFASEEEKIATYVKNISFHNVFDEDLNGNGIFDDNEYRSWETEFVALETGVRNIIAIDNLVDEEGKINLSDLSKEESTIALNNLNIAYLTHDALGTLMKNVYTDGFHVAHFQLDALETERTPDYYLDRIPYDTFKESKLRWDVEIVNIVDFKEEIGSSIKNIDFSLEGVDIAGILKVASESNILHPMFSDFLYSIIKDAGLNQYISIISLSGNTSYSSYFGNYSDSDPLKVDKLRRDTIDFLSNERVDSWEYEGKVLDEIIHEMHDLSSIDIKDASSELANKVSALFGLSYKYIGTEYNYDFAADSNENSAAITEMINQEKYNRGYLASELMLNYLDEKINTADYSVTYLEDIRYDYSYICFNDYEKIALKNIVEFAAQLKNCSSVADLLSVNYDSSKYMGPGDSLTSAKRDENHILLKDGWNSNIAVELIASNYLENVINEKFATSFNGLFKVENKPIEYAANNEWNTNLQNAILGI